MSAPDDPPLPPATIAAGAPHAYPYAGPPPPGYQPLFDLCSPGQITVATFLTGPLTATWLLARNFGRMGAARARLTTWIVGVLGTIAVFAAAFALPERAPGHLVALPQVLVAWLVAQNLQGPGFRDHLARAGVVTRNGRVALIAFAALALQLGGIAAVVVADGGLADDALGPKVEVGPGHDVIYRRGATRAEAERVGATLIEHGYLETGRGATVLVERHDRATVVLVVGDAAFGGGFDADLRDIADRLSTDAFDGAAVDLWLADDALAVKRRLPWRAPPE